MNDIVQTAASGSTTTGDDTSRLAGLRQVTLVTYALYALSPFVGLTAVVAIIINYVKRDDARGTVYDSHFTWQIRTFWWGLLWAVIGGATAWIVIGFGILAINMVWMIYRVVRGFLNWNDGKAMPV